MQAVSHSDDNPLYSVGMQTGRPPKTGRCPFGERLHGARETKGLSQRQVAEALNMAQQTYAAWERRPVAIKPEDLMNLAKLLDIEVTELLGDSKPKPKRVAPTGKARKVFEAVSQLPRYQQQRILGVVEDMMTARTS